MPTTEENLKTAFAGESQAHLKYLAYAKKAEHDGFPNVARLFRAAAEAETIHALGHLRSMGGIGATVENLREALAGETYEHTTMYPSMLTQAEQECHCGQAMVGMALKAEVVHANLYRQALDSVLSGKDLATADICCCPVCGHLETGRPNTNCPICLGFSRLVS